MKSQIDFNIYYSKHESAFYNCTNCVILKYYVMQ